MQKKIIALAIASAMTVPALAYAEATVYGQARLSIDMANNGATTNSVSNNQLNNQASRVGLKGSEDLGGGLSAVWQMEGTVSMDVGSTGTSLFNRNTYLGLKSADMGTLVLGRNDTPYKTSTRKLDVFIDTAADNRGGDGTGVGTGNTGLMSGHDLRLANSLTYTSPSMNGMSVAAASVFGAETSTAPADKKGSSLSLAGMYEQGPIYATLAYQTITAGTAGTGDLGQGGASAPGLSTDDKASAFKLGGSYTMDAITVNAVFESLTVDPIASADNITNTNLYIAGKFGLSSTDAVKAAFTKAGASKAGSVTGTDGATQFAIGYDHAMSKTTTVYALYSKVTNDTTGSSGTGLAGADPSVLSFGMNHSF